MPLAEIHRDQSVPFSIDAIGDSAHTAPGWREIGMFYTQIPEPGFEPDPEVTQALQRYDPGLRWLWCQWVFAPPGPLARHVKFGRHVLARYKPDPYNRHQTFYVQRAPNTVDPPPNIIEFMLDSLGNDPEFGVSDLPGRYEPWDWTLYWRILNAPSTQAVLEHERKRKQYLIEAREKRRQEELYERRDLERYVQKQADNISEVQAREYWRAARPNRVR